MSIGQRISELRKRNRYSQEYVAEKIGVSRQAVSKWETDISAPDTYNLIALAALFDVSVEYIASGKQAEPSQSLSRTEPKHTEITIQKIVGAVLLGMGSLALILGALFSELLILLSVYLITGGVLCLAVRKKLWFAAAWTFLALTFFIITVLTTQNLFCIFNPAFYRGGLTVGMIISYVFWIWLIAVVGITVSMAVKKHKTKAE